MAIKINGKVYQTINDEGQRGLTLGETSLIEREFHKPLEKIFAASDITAKVLAKLPEDKRDEIEVERRVAFLVLVWIARLRAGEKLTYAEAVDVEVEQLDEVTVTPTPLAPASSEALTLE